MDPVKQARPANLASSIKKTTDAHVALHGGLRHRAMDSKQRRAAQHEMMEAQLKVNNPLGKGIA